jgi:hypothetical protein
MILKFSLVLCTAPIQPNFYPLELSKHNYAAFIPYESLHEIDQNPNKNTLEYNTMTTKELIIIQNQKIIKELENSLKHNK